MFMKNRMSRLLGAAALSLACVSLPASAAEHREIHQNKLSAALEKYAAHFDHPGWQPLGH
ncbi:MAG: hypothetical protein FJY34_13005 [Betaproteobacteria bacterium]|nr:hypothetical protein [Betaproteobacteria bacterium]